MTHVTCRLTAKNRDQLRNPTLGNRVWATFTFLLSISVYSTMPSRGSFDTADACLYSTTMKAFVNTESIGSNPLLGFVVGLSYDLITQATCFLSSHGPWSSYGRALEVAGSSTFTRATPRQRGASCRSASVRVYVLSIRSPTANRATQSKSATSECADR